MGFFRFRQTFRIAPGIRLNLSKSGLSISFGPRGLHYTIGPKGTRTTVGLPGSGISWTSYQSYQSPTTAPNRPSGDSDLPKQDQNTTVCAPIEQLVATDNSFEPKPPPLPSEYVPIPAGTDLSVAYANESGAARTLALEHGKFWEYSLIGELLRSKLQILKGEYDRFDESLRATPRNRFPGPLFLSWISSEAEALSSSLSKLTTCMEKELIASLGPPGVSGDAIMMLNTVNALFGFCRSFLAFELTLCAADISSGFQSLKTAFRGITPEVIGFVEQLTDQWNQNVDGLRAGSREFSIHVSITMPQLKIAIREIERIMARH